MHEFLNIFEVKLIQNSYFKVNISETKQQTPEEKLIVVEQYLTDIHSIKHL